MHKHKDIVGQFLAGLAVAIVSGTVLAPAGAGSFNRPLATAGLAAGLVFLALALGRGKKR